MLVQSQQEMAAALEVVDITTKVADVIDDMTYRMVFGCNKDRMDDLKTLVNPCSREHQVGRNLKKQEKDPSMTGFSTDVLTFKLLQTTVLNTPYKAKESNLPIYCGCMIWLCRKVLSIKVGLKHLILILKIYYLILTLSIKVT